MNLVPIVALIVIMISKYIIIMQSINNSGKQFTVQQGDENHHGRKIFCVVTAPSLE
jgi:hypothetical protein